MTEPCIKDTEIALIKRDIDEHKRDIDAIAADVKKLREDVNAILSEAGNFKVVLRIMQILGGTSALMLVDYFKKRMGF